MFTYDRPQSVRMFTLADGNRGILQTVALMRELVRTFKADHEIRSLALSLVEGVPAKDDSEEVERLFLFVRDGIRYVRDIYGVETVHTPPEVLRIGQGDCDDKSVLLASLLESVGYETAFKVAGYNGPDYEHVYVCVRASDGGWVHLDPTEFECAGWEAPGRTAEAYVQ